jgi:hypothetical protein
VNLWYLVEFHIFITIQCIQKKCLKYPKLSI